VGEVLKNPRKGQLTPAAMVYLERRAKEGCEVESLMSVVKFATSLDAERQTLLSDKSKKILGSVAKRIGLKNITVTSTIRYPS